MRTVRSLLVPLALAAAVGGATPAQAMPTEVGPVRLTAAAPLPVTDVVAPVTRQLAGVTASSLTSAVRRIPGYAKRKPATWVVSRKYGVWGTADWYRNTVYIAPDVPADKLDSVVRHEWSHLLQGRAYGGDISTAKARVNAAFGGASPGRLGGVERAADCMARQLGATWTRYTTCADKTWRARATTLLNGGKV